MIIDIINRLLESGELDQLIEAKLMRPSVKKKRAAYLFFNNEMLITRDKPTAITNTSDTLKTSERTVYKSINIMEMGKKETGASSSEDQS